MAKVQAIPVEKYAFLAFAQRKLRLLAIELGIPKDAYNVSKNKGGDAVCGEVYFHADSVYIQVRRDEYGSLPGILIRSCKGRKDFRGGHNNFAPNALLNDIPVFAQRVRDLVPEVAEWGRDLES